MCLPVAGIPFRAPAAGLFSSMRRLWAAIALTTTAALWSGCEPQVTVCPAIAMAPVVSLTITAEYAPTIKTVHLKACQDGKCREGDLELRPGSVSLPQSCRPEPDGSCSAVTSPDGTRYGFLNMGTLTSSPIDAEVTGTDTNGGTLPRQDTQLHAEKRQTVGRAVPDRHHGEPPARCPRSAAVLNTPYPRAGKSGMRRHPGAASDLAESLFHQPPDVIHGFR